MFRTMLNNETNSAAVAINAMAEEKLQKFADKANRSARVVFNNHNCLEERLVCLAIQADGTVIRLMESAHSVSGLHMSDNTKHPLYVGVGSVGGVFHPIRDYLGIDWKKSIEKYNEDQLGYGNSNMVIVGYYLF